MAGVEILATEQVATAFGFNWNTYIFLIVISAAVASFMFGIVFFQEYGGWSFLIGLGIGTAVAGLIALVPSFNTLPIEYTTQYKVTISDEVQMNDFLSRYEIISTEGKIYTVRELVND